ncbi:NAD(P)/FAD-dependent oxidoreductase [Brevundimonas guildfordensis]|uniref:FAD-binding oxidoreductase n=1 Tax=Brevundimonas guildfordensis TaxID=2762241 RepID=A0ABR8R0X5_9CAUL|nr:FAD-binding oxidoreductase [Brevundimonas guildfordensis]MBD7941425.1 FAD-binding oxidoreductase [Brevundimonas guildfordensis]
MRTARRWAVVGGGLVGAATALRLQAAGFETVLIDRGDPRRGASFGNIGHIAAEQCEPMPSPATLKGAVGRLFAFGGPLDFRARDASLWGPWALRFLAASRPAAVAHGAEVLAHLLDDPVGAWVRLAALAEAPKDLIRATGHTVVWSTPEAARRGLAGWNAARIGAARFRVLETEELAAYGAVLSQRPAGGIRFTGTGQVSEPQAVRDALLAAFAARGGQTMHADATAIRPVAHAAEVALSNGTTVTADRVVVAAGAWSERLMTPLSVRAPLIGERGYSVQSAQHDWPDDLPLTVFEDRALAVARFDGGLRASSHVEFGAPSARPDPRKWRSIEAHLRDLGVAFSAQPDRWCGPRPTLPDYLPAIGRLQAHPQVHYAFGHQHLGLTTAARTAEIVEQMALGRPAPDWIDALRIERFG